MTAYNPSIPQSYDLISVSQPAILENFTQLNTQFSVEHTDFVSGSPDSISAKSGFHKQATMPYLTAPLSGTPATGQGTYYTSQVNTFGTTTQAVYKSGDTGSTATAILSAIKCWGYFTISGTTPTLVDSYNVASVAYAGSDSLYLVTMSTTLTNTSYGIITGGSTSQSGGGTTIISALSFRIYCPGSSNSCFAVFKS